MIRIGIPGDSASRSDANDVGRQELSHPISSAASFSELPDICHHIILNFLIPTEAIRLTSLCKSYRQLVMTLPWCEKLKVDRRWLKELCELRNRFVPSRSPPHISSTLTPMNCYNWLNACVSSASTLILPDQTELNSLPSLRTGATYEEYDLPCFRTLNWKPEEAREQIDRTTAAATITEAVATKVTSCLSSRFNHPAAQLSLSNNLYRLHQLVIPDQIALQFWEIVAANGDPPLHIDHVLCHFAFNQIERLSFPVDSSIATIQFPSSGDVDKYLIARQRFRDQYDSQLMVGAFWVNLTPDLLQKINRTEIGMIGQYVSEAKADLIYFKFEADKKESGTTSRDGRRVDNGAFFSWGETTARQQPWTPPELQPNDPIPVRAITGHPSGESLVSSNASTRTSDRVATGEDRSDDSTEEEEDDGIEFDLSLIQTLVFSGFNPMSERHSKLFTLLRGKRTATNQPSSFIMTSPSSCPSKSHSSVNLSPRLVLRFITERHTLSMIEFYESITATASAIRLHDFFSKATARIEIRLPPQEDEIEFEETREYVADLLSRALPGKDIHVY